MEYFESISLAMMANKWMIWVLLWALVWKGFALWRAARNGSKVWFIVFIVVNTLGILEALYLFVFGKKKN